MSIIPGNIDTSGDDAHKRLRAESFLKRCRMELALNNRFGSIASMVSTADHQIMGDAGFIETFGGEDPRAQLAASKAPFILNGSRLVWREGHIADLMEADGGNGDTRLMSAELLGIATFQSLGLPWSLAEFTKVDARISAIAAQFAVANCLDSMDTFGAGTTLKKPPYMDMDLFPPHWKGRAAVDIARELLEDGVPNQPQKGAGTGSGQPGEPSEGMSEGAPMIAEPDQSEQNDRSKAQSPLGRSKLDSIARGDGTSRGNKSSGSELDYIDCPPRVDWRSKLRDAVTSSLKRVPDGLRHNRINKRLSISGIKLPPTRYTTVGELVCFLDTSGSNVGNLGAALAEVSSAALNCGADQAVVAYIECSVSHIEAVPTGLMRSGLRHNLFKPRGGGGTAMEEIPAEWGRLKKERNPIVLGSNPKIVIVLTDGETAWPDQETWTEHFGPGVAAVWVIFQEGTRHCHWTKPSFGMVIEVTV